MRLSVLFLLLPWWAYFSLATGVGALTEYVWQDQNAVAMVRAEAAQRPPPDPVDLSRYTASHDLHPGGEVAVTGWLNPDYNRELSKSFSFVPTRRGYMWVFFGAEDGPDSQTARAAVVVPLADKARFGDLMMDNMVGQGRDRPSVLLRGLAGAGRGLSAVVDKAFADEGLARSPDFLFIEPFLDGRAAGLAGGDAPLGLRLFGSAGAAVLALFGVVRLRLRRRRLKSGESVAEAPMAMPRAATTSARINPDSPLGRFVAKREAGAGAPELTDMLSPDFGTPDFGSPGPGAAKGPPRAAGTAAKAASEAGNATAFYLKLGLGMVVIGGLAYRPAVIGVALPFLTVAAFWYGVLVVVRGIRKARGDRKRAAIRIDSRPVAPLRRVRDRARDAGPIMSNSERGAI